jgi:hypothetical protein
MAAADLDVLDPVPRQHAIEVAAGAAYDDLMAQIRLRAGKVDHRANMPVGVNGVLEDMHNPERMVIFQSTPHSGAK